eukprot:686097-Lingulodinium_polyedra.AAC.1
MAAVDRPNRAEKRPQCWGGAGSENEHANRRPRKRRTQNIARSAGAGPDGTRLQRQVQRARSRRART